MIKKISLVISMSVVLANVSAAQDPNFSQFFASPLTLNPALTGKFDGVYRFASNYRNQWPTINNAYQTMTASLDMSVLQNNIPETDQFGIGIMGYSDKAGNGVLNSTHYALSAAYHKGLDEDGYHQVGVGFQGAFVNKRLDVTKVVFEDQLTPNGFTGITNEIFANDQVNVKYFDMNAGLFYNGTTNGYNNFYLGASMYHINRPKESFQGGKYLLAARTTLQAGGRIPVGAYNYVHFAANHSIQAKAHNTMIGGAYSLNLSNDNTNPSNLYLGSWIRFGDAIIPYVGLEVGGFHFGFSYDVNTSSLKPGSNTRGGGEISLIYIKRPDNSDSRLSCPKF